MVPWFTEPPITATWCLDLIFDGDELDLAGLLVADGFSIFESCDGNFGFEFEIVGWWAFDFTAWLPRFYDFCYGNISPACYRLLLDDFGDTVDCLLIGATWVDLMRDRWYLSLSFVCYVVVHTDGWATVGSMGYDYYDTELEPWESCCFNLLLDTLPFGLPRPRLTTISPAI